MKTAGVFILTEIPEISVGSQMNRSNRNLPFHFWETGSFAVLIFTNTLYEISEKEWSRIPPGWAGLIKEKKNVWTINTLYLCHYLFMCQRAVWQLDESDDSYQTS